VHVHAFRNGPVELATQENDRETLFRGTFTKVSDLWRTFPHGFFLEFAANLMFGEIFKRKSSRSTVISDLIAAI